MLHASIQPDCGPQYACMHPHTCSAGTHAGMPDFTAGWWLPLYNVGRQMTLAILICLIDICESISIAKAMARVNK